MLVGTVLLNLRSSRKLVASSTGQRGLIKQHTIICIWLPSDLTWPHIAFVLISHCVGWTSGHWNELAIAITANTNTNIILYWIKYNGQLTVLAVNFTVLLQWFLFYLSFENYFTLLYCGLRMGLSNIDLSIFCGFDLSITILSTKGCCRKVRSSSWDIRLKKSIKTVL